MQKIPKGKEAFIILLFLSVFLINLPFRNNYLRPYESKNLPKPNSLSTEYDFEWFKDWGSSYNDYGTDVKVDSNGFIYVCGYTNITGSEDYDMVLIKYNKSGVEQWSRTWGGPDDDSADCLVLDNSSNIYMAGYTKNAGDSDGDLCVVKFDSSGNYLMNVTWGGDDFDEARGIAIDSFGNIYVGGNTKSYGDPDGDSVLMLFNSSLSLLWNSTWGGDLADVTQDVEVDSEDYIYVVGHSDSMDPDADEYDNYFLKYNSFGVLQWAEDWDASWTQRGMNLAIDSNDNLYLAGYTFGHPAGSMKGLLLKYDKNGNYQWHRTYGEDGVYGDSWRAITILPNDDIYVGGYSITRRTWANGDCILLNYDTSGNRIWTKVWGEMGTESLYGLTYDSELNIYCAGSSSSVGAGEYDIIALKFQRSLSDYPFEIISPENVVYNEPMIGYYPATHGFENCDNDEFPVDWSFVPHHDYGEAYVVENLDGHNKVLKIEDTYQYAYPEAFQEFNPQTIGTMELYLRKETGASGFYLNLYDSSGVIAFNIKMDQDNNGKFEIGLGNAFTEFARGKYSDQTWFHFRIDFNTYTDEATIFLDGIIVANIEFSNFVENISRIRLGANYANTGVFYADAIGYSWDENYITGDNLNEGLLVSYNTEVNLSWVGYSLDGGSNITIVGNKVIPLPENGIHSLVLSAITSSLGTHIKAGPRVFIMDIPYSPLPPIIPIPVFPIILTSIGIGIIALLGICLIVFRRKISGRTGAIIVPQQEILVDERIDSGRDQFKFCPFCGNPIKKTHHFCVNCGASLKNI